MKDDTGTGTSTSNRSSQQRCTYHHHQRSQQHQQALITLINNSSTKSMDRSAVHVVSQSTRSKLQHPRFFRAVNITTSTTGSNSMNLMRNKKTMILFVILVIMIIGVVVGLYNQYKYLPDSDISFFSITSEQNLPQSVATRNGLNHITSTSTGSNDRHMRNTKIPHILIFTHHVNLLTTNLDGPHFTNRKLNELRVLQQNVHRIIALHSVDDHMHNDVDSVLSDALVVDSTATIGSRNNSVHVRFLTDDDCIQSIRQWANISSHRNHIIFVHQKNVFNMDPKYNNPEDIANELISYFQHEPIGMYKADLCRGVALYETGGMYMDVDLGTRMNVFNLLLESTEFATVNGYNPKGYFGIYPATFFQAFMAASAYHDVIHRYIQLFILHYRHTIRIKYSNIGVHLLKRAYDEVQLEQELVWQQMNGKREDESSLSTTESSSAPLHLTHLQQTTELWQEVLYKRHYHDNIFAHVPRPTWGRRNYLCKIVIVIPPSQPLLLLSSAQRRSTMIMSNITMTQLKLIVPMYSRIAGSRRCPN